MLKSWKQLEAEGTSGKDPRGGRRLKLILHVGPHKTGTTSLQRALLKQYGSAKPQKIWYPEPSASGPGHAAISRAVLGRKGFSEAQPAIRHQIDEALQSPSCQVLILSSEGFAHAYPDHFASLAEQTVGTDTHILVTLSPIGRRVVSIWQEMVKHGRRKPLENAEGFLDHSSLVPDLASCLARNFPSARIGIVIADKLSPTSLYALFSEATGIPLPTPRSADEIAANPSLGVVEAEILRGLNIGRASAELTDQQYLKARGELRKLFVSERWSGTIPTVPLTLPKDWIAPLKKRCAETIQQLRELEADNRVEIFGSIESLDDVTGSE